MTLTTRGSSKVRLGDQTVNVADTPLGLPNGFSYHTVPGQEFNWDPAGIEVDRKGSGQDMYYNLDPRYIRRSADWLTEGVESDPEYKTRFSDGRSMYLTETYQEDVTIEADFPIYDLSSQNIAVPGVFNSNPDPVSEGGVWYIGPSRDADTRGGILVGAGPNFAGITVRYVGATVASGDGSSLIGRVVVGTLGDGAPENAGVVGVSAGDLSLTAGEVLNLRVNVSNLVINVWADDVQVITDLALPAECQYGTQHGVYGAETEQNYDTDLGFAHYPYTISYDETAALPRVTVNSTSFQRNGEEIKFWGWGTLAIDFHKEFLGEPSNTATGAANRELILAETQGNRRMGGNLARFHCPLFSIIGGTGFDNVTVNQTAIDNLLWQLDESRKARIYCLLLGLTQFVPSEEVPAWFDLGTQEQRWQVYERFWDEVSSAIVAAGLETTVVAYDIINEPTVAANAEDSWWGPSFLGTKYHFNQAIARDPAEGAGTAMRNFLTRMMAVIKANDPDSLCTMGYFAHFPFGPGGYTNTDDILDFLSPHSYPPLGTSDSQDWQDQVDLYKQWTDNGATPSLVGEINLWSEYPDFDNDYFSQIISQAKTKGISSQSYGYPPEWFPTAPGARRPPAEANDILDDTIYARHARSQRRMRVFKDDFYTS